MTAFLSMLDELFRGLPVWVQVLFWITFVVIAASIVSLVALLIAARRFRGRMRGGEPGAPDGFLWVFVVPALNEEVTIADSVARLRATTARNALFLVIDDGSDDRTGEILAGIDDPRLRVLTRRAPDARQGKAAALNAAYRALADDILREPAFAGWDDDHVILAIVDADGRLAAEAPDAVASHFCDPRLGGVQTLVRIYNRRGWLTWCQDVEFSSFGLIFQAGRAWWGVANMGGNGQFNRLAALRAIDEGDGPWRDRLTEDQDLGVRLIQAGWGGAQENGVSVQQQGLNSLRRLFRQRVRWAQGNWQALSLLAGVGKPDVPWTARLDSVFYLLTPALQLLTGLALVTSIVETLVDDVPYRPSYWFVLVFFLALSFGPGIATLVLRGGRWYSPLLAVVQVVPYLVYTWLTFFALAWALVRLAAGRTSWAKTARESVGDADAAPLPARSLP